MTCGSQGAPGTNIGDPRGFQSPDALQEVMPKLGCKRLLGEGQKGDRLW